MARKTYSEIRVAGGVIAGNDAADDWIETKMNAWLRKHYAAYAWPFLIKQATSVTLPAASTGTEIGAGQAGLTPQITRIFSPIYFRANGYSTRGKAPCRQIVGDDEQTAIGQVDPSNQTGQPESFIQELNQRTDGSQNIILVPYPVPDKAYTLSFTYQKLPDDLADTDVPLYPNEMTLIQAAKCAALEYDETGSQLLSGELEVLSSMVAADRDTYGGSESFGNVHQLDSSVFK